MGTDHRGSRLVILIMLFWSWLPETLLTNLKSAHRHTRIGSHPDTSEFAGSFVFLVVVVWRDVVGRSFVDCIMPVWSTTTFKFDTRTFITILVVTKTNSCCSWLVGQRTNGFQPVNVRTKLLYLASQTEIRAAEQQDERHEHWGHDRRLNHIPEHARFGLVSFVGCTR